MVVIDEFTICVYEEEARKLFKEYDWCGCLFRALRIEQNLKIKTKRKKYVRKDHIGRQNERSVGLLFIKLLFEWWEENILGSMNTDIGIMCVCVCFFVFKRGQAKNTMHKTQNPCGHAMSIPCEYQWKHMANCTLHTHN